MLLFVHSRCYGESLNYYNNLYLWRAACDVTLLSTKLSLLDMLVARTCSIVLPHFSYRYGVISTPELTGWQLLSANDSFLIASSDGVFEKMTMQDVCDMMLHAKLGVNQDFDSFAVAQQNLADYVVHLALQKGTTDNVAAVVVPLGSPSSSGATIEDWHHIEENSRTSLLPLQSIPYQHKSGRLSVRLLILLIATTQ
jgi:hypothetical protein